MKNLYFIKKENSENETEYFLQITGTKITTVSEIQNGCPFDTLESAQALIDYVLPKPLLGSWKVIMHVVSNARN